MAMLEIDGVGRVEVGNDFLSLPPDRQAAEVEAIAASLKATPVQAAAAPEQPTDIVKRGSILPAGRTREGNLVPAVPEFIEGPRKTIMDLLEGKRTSKDISGKEVFELGMLFGGGSSANATGAGIARAAAKATPEELTALSGPGIPGLRGPAQKGTPTTAVGDSAAVAPELVPAAAAETVQPAATAESAAARPAAVEAAQQTPAELKTASKSFYRKAEEAGITISPESYRPLAKDIFTSAEKAGLDETLTPDSVAAIKRIVGLAKEPKGKPGEPPAAAPITLEKLDLMRQIASDAQAAVKPSDRRVAGIIVDKIDDYIAKLSVKDVISGDPKIAAEVLPKARELWSKASKLETVDRLVDRAKTSSPNFSASGMENALRTEFRHLAKNDGAMRKFTPEERTAIKKVARGTAVGNTARNLGKLAPTGIVSAGIGGGIGASIGSLVGMPVAGAIAAGAVGFSARHLATVLTRRNIAQLEQTILKGGESAMAKAALNRSRRQLAILEGAAASSSADAQTKRRK